MADAKTICPKCGGHVSFPKELAGKEAPCPHCNETILLPQSKSAMPWVVAGIFALITVCLASMLIWQHHAGSAKTPQGTSIQNTPQASTAESVKSTGNEQTADDSDIQTMKNLCMDYYNAINNQDAEGLRATMSESCRAALRPEDLKKYLDGGAKYDFESLESVRFQDGVSGKCATARVKRTVQQQSMGIIEGWHDFRFVQESSGWKVFDNYGIMDAIVSRFLKSGFTDEIRADIKLLRDCDPFDSWDENDTNALAKIFSLSQGQTPVFPWDVEFLVESNSIDGFTLLLNYSVRNNSSVTWTSPLLEFDLKQNGKVVLSGNDLLPDVSPGRQLVRNTSFFLSSELPDTTRYYLDVYYPIGFSQKSVQLAQNVPLDFRVQKVSDLAKLEVVSTQFDLATSEDFQNMLCARINYRVKNTSTEAIKNLDIKCVWYSQTGEQLDQSTEYVVGYGDVPLGVGQFKTGFIRCGKGYRDLRVPVKVDVYLESGERRSLVFKGLLVQ